MTFRAFAGHHAALPYAGRLMMFLVLLALSPVIVNGALVGRLECVDITSTPPTASRCALRIDVAQDLFDMSSFTFAGLAAANEELPLVYNKTKSTKRVLENGGTDTIWEGRDEGFGTATLILDTNGGLAGSFSTSISVFTVLPSAADDSAGMLRIQENKWADALDSGGSSATGGGGGAGGGVSVRVNGASILKHAATIIVKPQPTEEKTTSRADAGSIIQSPVEDGNHNRMLRADRHLQITSVVDVLLLVTNRALCESANLPLGCPNTSSNRAPLESLLNVVLQQTNQGMQGVGVPVQVRFVSVIYLQPGYDARPNQEAIDMLRTDATIAQWRRNANADLVAMITGDDPTGQTGGIAYEDDYVSVTSYKDLPYYTLNHLLFHNFGARHDRDNSYDFHPYGHALQVPGYFRTIVAQDCPNSDCPQIVWLSANGYTYNDIPIGNATHDNARLVKENAPRVAALSDALAPPVAPPVKAPVIPPVKAPVAPPVKDPAAPPIAPPVKAPVALPVAPPVKAPVAPPVAPPIAPPVKAPVAPPVAPPVKAPVALPVASPVKAPVAPPVAPPVTAIVTPPFAPSITPAPVTPPTAQTASMAPAVPLTAGSGIGFIIEGIFGVIIAALGGIAYLILLCPKQPVL